MSRKITSKTTSSSAQLTIFSRDLEQSGTDIQYWMVKGPQAHVFEL